LPLFPLCVLFYVSPPRVYLLYNYSVAELSDVTGGYRGGYAFSCKVNPRVGGDEYYLTLIDVTGHMYRDQFGHTAYLSYASIGSAPPSLPSCD
jgi:hypothetical protein